MVTIPHPTLIIELEDDTCVLTGTFKSNYVFGFLTLIEGQLKVLKLTFRSLRSFVEEEVVDPEKLRDELLEEIGSLIAEAW